MSSTSRAAAVITKYMLTCTILLLHMTLTESWILQQQQRQHQPLQQNSRYFGWYIHQQQQQQQQQPLYAINNIVNVENDDAVSHVNTTASNEDETNAQQQGKTAIYTMPELYDIAFGYRDYDEEVQFLLSKHYQYNTIENIDLEQEQEEATSSIRVLEVAAGPARHSITALQQHTFPIRNSNIGIGNNNKNNQNDDDDNDNNETDNDDTTVHTIHVNNVVCIDNSIEMKNFAMEIASEELSNEQITKLQYHIADMRNFSIPYEKEQEQKQQEQDQLLFDTSWILLGSLQHLLTNNDIIQCLSSISNTLKPGGTIIIELPHPRELFQIGDCTKNNWNVPLYDFDNDYTDDDNDNDNSIGEIQIVWGNDNDIFDPITQIRQLSININVVGSTNNNLQSINEIVPQRYITFQEIITIAQICNLDVISTLYGSLDDNNTNINDEETAYRLVCILRKKND